MLKRFFFGLILIGLLVSGCSEPTMQEKDAQDKVIFEEALKSHFSGANDDYIALLCTDSPSEKLDTLNILYEDNERFIESISRTNVSFDVIARATKILIFDKVCEDLSKTGNVAQWIDLYKAEDEQEEKRTQEFEEKFGKEIENLDKKANQLGNGTYTEMLMASSELENLILDGAEFSLTGQERMVEAASCSATRYSTWADGEPDGTWYCYLDFLDGGEPYTVNVNGSRWGGKADRGASAGDFLKFKLSSGLKDWLNSIYKRYE